VTVRFELPNGPGHATWSFDPRKLTLTPENETALALSSAEALGAGPLPKLRPVVADGAAKHPSNKTSTIPLPQTSATPVTARPDTTNQPTVRLTQEQLPKPVESSNVSELPVRSTIKEAIAKAAETIDEPVAPQAEAAPRVVEPATTTSPIELLDALRAKRIERETSQIDELPHKVTGAERPLIPVAEPEPVTSSIRIINDEPLVEAELPQIPAVEAEDEVFDTEVAAEAEAERPKSEPKRGRASIPSWDEIVFGTKTDEN
jgi:hypothetical protein